MGLSGRKQKQKIQNDPRNLSWADDASRFGSSYLSKFGWDSSRGLGATGEGMTSHIKVSQKLDMMGIGAAHQKDPNGIAWKQNRDFENLLKRLNAASGTTETTTLDIEMKEEFVAQTMTQVKDEVEEDEKAMEKRVKKEKKRKEKGEKKEKKKDKKRKHEGEEEECSEKKKRRKANEEPSEKSKEMPTPAPTPAPTKQAAPPRHRAHRARAIAAKSISHKSSIHISEILGVAPSASTSESTSALASGSSTPAEQGKLTVISELEKLTTSTKSVADYFKEKLQLKSLKASSAISTPADSSESSTPTVGLGLSRKTSDWEEERPAAGGLGFGAGGPGFGGGGLGFSKVRLEVKEECNLVEEATMMMGLSKFSSLTSSKFLTSETMNFDAEIATPGVSELKIEEVVDSSSGEGQESREERKKRRKAEKERKKAEVGGKEKGKEKKGKKEEDSVEKRERKEKKERGKEKAKKSEEV